MKRRSEVMPLKRVFPTSAARSGMEEGTEQQRAESLHYNKLLDRSRKATLSWLHSLWSICSAYAASPEWSGVGESLRGGGDSRTAAVALQVTVPLHACECCEASRL